MNPKNGPVLKKAESVSRQSISFHIDIPKAEPFRLDSVDNKLLRP
jgi:hypothetical protein